MRKEILKKIIAENPEAVLVKNKYKVLVGLVKRMFPNNYEKISVKMWEDIAYEIVNGDRDWRLLTQGKDKKNKGRLEEQKLVQLGYNIKA